MKRYFWLFSFFSFLFTFSCALAQFSFYLIDNFENGKSDHFYVFGNLAAEVVQNSSAEAEDPVAQACGDYSLAISGTAENWYVGGIGTDLNLDATPFRRVQLDVYGSETGGKLKIELFDDDNKNFSLEQDPTRDWLPTNDDKWVVEVPILGKGFTRYSIPFSAFKLENPGCGDGIWNPDQKDGSGGLLKIQVVVLASSPAEKVQAKIDNLILTR
jgi:hypothetical protein